MESEPGKTEDGEMDLQGNKMRDRTPSVLTSTSSANQSHSFIQRMKTSKVAKM